MGGLEYRGRGVCHGGGDLLGAGARAQHTHICARSGFSADPIRLRLWCSRLRGGGGRAIGGHHDSCLFVAGGGCVAAGRVGGFGWLWWWRADRADVPFAVRDGAFDQYAAERLCAPAGDSVVLETRSGLTVDVPLPPDATYHRLPPAGWSNRRSAGFLGRENVTDTVYAAAPTIALGLGATFDVVRSALILDDAVLRALTQLSGEQVGGLAGFREVVAARDYQLDSSKIQGTVAEQVSAEHFAQGGVQVQWPEGGATGFGPSNNPGWDYSVDGAEVNVKLWSDAGAAARTHFATPENASIPIVVPADAANIPADAVYFDASTGLDPAALMGEEVVVVDGALTLAGIESMTEEAMDAAVPVDIDVGSDLPLSWPRDCCRAQHHARGSAVVRGQNDRESRC